MDGAWSSAAVRRAEAELMPRLPPGELMRRAAAGLATVSARLLRETPGHVYGATVVVLAGPGDNGGDALYAAARLARRGAAVHAVPVMGSRVHRLAAEDLVRAGGRFTDRPPLSCDLLLDGILGIGGRPGLPDRAADLLARIDAARTVAVD